MAETATAKDNKRKQTSRPIVVLYRKGKDGDLEVETITRDAYKVIEMMDNDASLRYKKVDAKVGR